MDNITRRDRELPYISDESVFEEQKVTRKLLGKFNTTDPSDFDALSEIVIQILRSSQKNVMIVPPFYCAFKELLNTSSSR